MPANNLTEDTASLAGDEKGSGGNIIVAALLTLFVAACVCVVVVTAQKARQQQRRGTILKEKEKKFDRERALQAEYPNAWKSSEQPPASAPATGGAAKSDTELQSVTHQEPGTTPTSKLAGVESI